MFLIHVQLKEQAMQNHVGDHLWQRGTNLVSRGQTAIFSFYVGAGKNRVWHISNTKLVLTPNKFWLGVNWIHVTHYRINSLVRYWSISIVS